jgi:hypothetical protein
MSKPQQPSRTVTPSADGNWARSPGASLNFRLAACAVKHFVFWAGGETDELPIKEVAVRAHVIEFKASAVKVGGAQSIQTFPTSLNLFDVSSPAE